MNGNEFYEFEDRAYINPTLSSGEQEKFIDNFRDIQNKNNQQIATDTYNLGKALPSNLGGLGGGEAYFNARYQTDPVDDMVANLKTAAQAQQLNDAMTNYNNQLKQRYNKAQQSYNRRRAKSGYGSGNSLLDALNNLFGTNKETPAKGNVSEENITGGSGHVGDQWVSSGAPGTTTQVSGQYVYTRDADGNIVNTDDPVYKKRANGYYQTDAQYNKQQLMNNPTAKTIVGITQLMKLMSGNR